MQKSKHSTGMPAQRQQAGARAQKGATLAPPSYGMSFIDQSAQRKVNDAGDAPVQRSEKGKWWGSAIGGTVGGVAGAVGGYMYGGLSAVKGGLTGLASGVAAGYQHGGFKGAIGGGLAGGVAGAAASYAAATVQGGVTGAMVGAALGGAVGDLVTGAGYQLGNIPPEVQPVMDKISKTSRGKILLESNYKQTGRALNVNWVPGAEAHTGANYDSTTNTINISMGAPNGMIETYILWELQNARQNWHGIQAEHHLDRNQAGPMSRQDKLRMVYHMEKSEYTSLVVQYKEGIEDGHPSHFAAYFNGGAAAPWASFSKYLQAMVASQHYANVFHGEAPYTMHELAPFVSGEDNVDHNWTKEKKPALYKRPDELLEFKID